MKGFFTSSLIGLVFVLGIHQGALGEEGDGAFERGTRSETPAYRLFYVFSPDKPSHRFHARELQELAELHRPRLQITGIVRWAQTDRASAEILKEFRTRNGLSYELLSTTAARRNPEVPAELKRKFSAADDCAVLVDAAGESAAVGSGREFTRMLSALRPEGIRTEVDDTTWGKIKVLFN